METIFIYFGKVILTSGVMFLYYLLFLKDKTFHHYNRFYLLSVLLVSLLLPLLKVSYFTLEVNNDIYLLINILQDFNSKNNLSHDFIYLKFAAVAFGLVSVFFLAKIIYGLAKIQQFKKQFSKENFGGINFYQTNLQEAPFSFFRNLFWKDSIHLQSDLGRQILKHEMVHIEQKHSWDNIFTEIATSLFWFNPFFYFIKKEINLIHEYLADKKAVQNSDTKAFAQMLLASHFSGKQFPATSPLLSSNLKKRLTMLKKSKTKFSYARRIFALPLLFILGFIYLVNAKNKEIKETNSEIEKMVSDLKIEQLNSILKLDTIIPKKSENPQIIILDSTKGNIGYGKDGTALYKSNPELFKDSDTKDLSSIEEVRKTIEKKRQEIEPLRSKLDKDYEIARKFYDEMRVKNDALKKLSEKKDWDNPDFSKLEKEMNEIGKKIDAVFNSEDFVKNQKLMEMKFSDMDKLYAQLDKLYNSDDFINSLKNAENFGKLLNEKELKEISSNAKVTTKDAEIAARDAAKLVNSKEFKKQIADAEKAAKNAKKLVNSKEYQQQIKDAQKAAEEATKNGNKSKVIILNSSGKGDENIKIYIDGKEVSKSEMERFPPEKIEKMEVNKKGYLGKKNAEIHITTKK